MNILSLQKIAKKSTKIKQEKKGFLCIYTEMSKTYCSVKTKAK